MIGCYNTGVSITNKLGGRVIDTPSSFEYEGVFLEWTPTVSDARLAETLLNQTVIVETCIKNKIPLVVFDKNMSIKRNEYDWLIKSNVKLFEPSVLPRRHFKYLPNWLEIRKMPDLKFNNNEKSVNIGYIGHISDRIKSFDEYIVNTKKINSDLSVKYNTEDVIIADKEIEYEKINVLKDNISYQDVQYTVIIGNQRDYMSGRLDASFIEALENNCIPFIPSKNRFYNALFTASDSLWFGMYYKMYDRVYLGMIHDIYERIEKYYPEMKINHTVDVIKKELGV